MRKGRRYMPSGTKHYPVIGDGHVATVNANGSVVQPGGVEEKISTVATVNEFIRYMVTTDEPVMVAGIDARNPPELPAEEPDESSRPVMPAAGSGIRDYETRRTAARMYVSDVVREHCMKDE